MRRGRKYSGQGSQESGTSINSGLSGGWNFYPYGACDNYGYVRDFSATVLSYRDNSNSRPEDSFITGLCSNRALHPLMLQPQRLEVLSKTSIINS